MSVCSECQRTFGCFFRKATPCYECQIKLCHKCAGKNALIPFDPKNPEASNDTSKNGVIFHYCDKCFQDVSVLDFSKTYDLFEQQPAEEPENEQQQKMNTTNGITFIMVHGGGGTRSMYRPHARKLTALGYRCLLPDLPGHGTMVGIPLTLDNCVETIRNLVRDESCDPRKTIYVGNSMGAYAGFYILDKMGDSFCGAVLMDCGQNVGPDCSVKARLGLFALRHVGANMSNERLMKMLMRVSRKSNADYHVVEAVYGSGMYFQWSAAQVDCIHTVNPSEYIPKFKFPVLYFNGSKDYRDSEEKWLALCKDQERSSLHVYIGGDHFFVHDSRFVDDMLKRMDTFAKAAII